MAINPPYALNPPPSDEPRAGSEFDDQSETEKFTELSRFVADVVPDVVAANQHAPKTLAVHGIADTSQLALKNDPRFTDARTPTAHQHGVTDLTATGRTNATFLRGDNTWAVPTGSQPRTGMLLTFAASDAPQYVKDRCDWTCPGKENTGGDAAFINTKVRENTNLLDNSSYTVVQSGQTLPGPTDTYNGISLSGGTFWFNSPLLIPNRGFVIEGQGPSTKIRKATSVSFTNGGDTSIPSALIKFDNTAAGNNAGCIVIRNLYLIAWYEGQSYIDAISLKQTISGQGMGTNSFTVSSNGITGAPVTGTDNDGNHMIENVHVYNANTAFRIGHGGTGGRAYTISQCYVESANIGIDIDMSDCLVTDCHFITGRGSPAGSAFKIAGGNVRLSNCKASYWDGTGEIGFDVGSSRATLDACEAQDCWGGFKIGGNNHNLVGCRADTQVPTASTGNYGFNILTELSTPSTITNHSIRACKVNTRNSGKMQYGVILPQTGNARVDVDITREGDPLGSGSDVIKPVVKQTGTSGGNPVYADVTDGTGVPTNVWATIHIIDDQLRITN